MLKQARGMAGTAKVRARVAAPDLPEGIIYVPIKVDAIALLVDEAYVLLGLDDATAAAHKQRSLRRKRAKDIRLIAPERILPFQREDLRDAPAVKPLHHSVGVEVTTVEHCSEVARERRLTRPEEPDEKDMISTALLHSHHS